MKRLYLLSLATILVSGQDVLTRFKEEEVAGAPGGVLSEAPEKLLEVRYEEQEVAADLGNNLAVSKTQSQPRVTFADAKSRNKYTLGELRHTLSLNYYNDNNYIQLWWTPMLPAETTPQQLSGSTGLWSTFLVGGEKY